VFHRHNLHTICHPEKGTGHEDVVRPTSYLLKEKVRRQ